jgi:hypothetical protein
MVAVLGVWGTGSTNHYPRSQGGKPMNRMLSKTMAVALCLTVVTSTVAQADDGPPPQIHSALYPSPVPYVPREVGWTVITNQALAPHEMLYAHQYRALYPPYYYKKSCCCCIPFIPQPCLKGTMVKVKYKTYLPWGFHPPYEATRNCFSNTQWR